MTQTPTAHTPAQAQARAHFTVPAKHPMVTVLGSGDALLRVIEQAFPAADIHVRGNEISAVGDPREVALVQRLLDEMMLVLRTGQPMTEDAVERSIAMLRAGENGEGPDETPAEVLTQNILSSRGRTIRPKTLNQKRYVDAIDKHTIVFGIGPAGTGKTYLAMAKAVQALQSKQVNRIILTRPAVEAGERLGFLPGTLYEKIDPYLRPLYDALHDMLDPDSIPRLMAAGTIEVAPLAYMRGRSQPIFTNVLTPDGWRPIGDLQVGDLVIGSNGEPTPVLGVYPQGEKGRLPGHRPGRGLDPLLWRTPVDGPHGIGQAPRQAVAGHGDPGDDRRPPRRARPPVRTADAHRTRLLPRARSSHGPVCARAPARRRLRDRLHHPVPLHRGRGTRPRLRGGRPRCHRPAQGRT
ncbi:PhoH family protein [Streptomyces sp. PmtG]